MLILLLFWAENFLCVWVCLCVTFRECEQPKGGVPPAPKEQSQENGAEMIGLRKLGVKRATGILSLFVLTLFLRCPAFLS